MSGKEVKRNVGEEGGKQMSGKGGEDDCRGRRDECRRRRGAQMPGNMWKINAWKERKANYS